MSGGGSELLSSRRKCNRKEPFLFSHRPSLAAGSILVLLLTWHQDLAQGVPGSPSHCRELPCVLLEDTGL